MCIANLFFWSYCPTTLIGFTRSGAYSPRVTSDTLPYYIQDFNVSNLAFECPVASILLTRELRAFPRPRAIRKMSI